MTNRNPIVVFLLTTFIPFYILYWFVVTGRELRAHGADIPTSWLLIVPIVNLWWYYKYSVGVEHATNGKISAVLGIILLLVLGSIGCAIFQDAFNKVTTASTPVGPTPVGPAAVIAASPVIGGPAPEAPASTPAPDAFSAPAPSEPTSPVPPTPSPAPQPPIAPPPSAPQPPAGPTGPASL